MLAPARFGVGRQLEDDVVALHGADHRVEIEQVALDQRRRAALEVGGDEIATAHREVVEDRHRSALDEAIDRANDSPYGLTAGFYGAKDEIPRFLDRIEAGVTYSNRPQGATTGAWPGFQPFGGWKGSGSTGKAIGSYYYVQQYLREQSQTIVD